MIQFDTALEILEKNILIHNRVKIVGRDKVHGKFLSKDIYAQADFPTADVSAMDGHCFHREDIEKGLKKFRVSLEITPDRKTPGPLKKETCGSITTGSYVPKGNVVVIPVEQTIIQNDYVVITTAPEKNPIRPRGSAFKKGDLILKKGTLIRAYELGILILLQIKKISVMDDLKVAIQVTGDEISEINNTNGPVIATLLRFLPGLKIKQLPVLKDKKALVSKRFIALLNQFDFIITSGGISMGKHDYVYDAFKDLGVKFLIRKISQKPGKPVSIGIYKNKVVCCLPGNPVSSIFCTDLYVQYILRLLSGQKLNVFLAKTNTSVNNNSSLDQFYPAILNCEKGVCEVAILPEIQSHVLNKLTSANAYVRVPGNTLMDVGDSVRVFPMMESF